MIAALKMAFRNIFFNKLRSFLTMLGIIIGVLAVVMLMSIGQGASGTITNSISDMGADLIVASVTDEDVTVTKEALTAYLPDGMVRGVTPVVSASATLKNGTSTSGVTVTGVGANYADVYGLTVQSGRFLADSDETWRTPVCVIGVEVAGDVFESYDVIGKTLTIDDSVYTVVGLLAEQGSSIAGSGDDMILLPLTTAQRVAGETTVSRYYIAAASTEQVETVQSILEATLYQLTADEDAYTVYNQSQILDTMDEVTNTVSLLLGGIASISLLVGGIGIMNIMLVTVTERTREIGIRKAVGAKRGHILFQFLVESCVLSVLGGLIGVALSFLGVEAFSLIADWQIAVSWNIALLAVGVCAALGILFGSYPANKAARLLPIDALRHV